MDTHTSSEAYSASVGYPPPHEPVGRQREELKLPKSIALLGSLTALAVGAVGVAGAAPNPFAGATTSAAALILGKNPTRTQAQIESTLKSTALAIPNTGTENIFDFDHFANVSWGTDCNGTPCDAVGSGLIQVDDALAATP
jgi:hypothetical protein